LGVGVGMQFLGERRSLRVLKGRKESREEE
jgi:hypothetical protein